ncbi:MAG: Gfo/Idh/MocA family oxidoreductase [Leptolyngbyaceae bacterium]|nr:Gfo/Idh/MocA family oxidoreductase [Leptolyngbyaceae bacterium]
MVVRVGLVGTGYAAQKRAEALGKMDRALLVGVSGQGDRPHGIAAIYHTGRTNAALGTDHEVRIASDWSTLVQRADIDLVVVATRNHLHGAMVRAALMADKHVVVEYPLALAVEEAESLIELGRSRQRLLHVEHIERLSGIHTTLQKALPQIGIPRYCHSTSFKGDNPAPQRWSYNALEFGFPLVAALSRIQRLIDLFGAVESVHCTCQYWNSDGQRFTPSPQQPMYAAVLCSASLRFFSGLWAEVVYGKGECFWSRERRFDVHGSTGRLLLDADGGELILANGRQALMVSSRRGLFAKDTAMVLDAIAHHQPLYITPEESLYALKVADAARRSAEIGRSVEVGALKP